MKQAKTKSVKTEAPISVKQHRSEGHSLETRVFERKILETFCVQPRYEFRGKRAAQGVCYDRKSLSGQKFKYLDAMEKYAVASRAAFCTLTDTAGCDAEDCDESALAVDIRPSAPPRARSAAF